MRTTIKLADELIVEAKGIAARTGRTFAEVVEDAVRDSLARRRRTDGTTISVPLPNFGEGGLQAGVDLDDSAELLDLMDGLER